jgi:hypothetical protein
MRDHAIGASLQACQVNNTPLTLRLYKVCYR